MHLGRWRAHGDPEWQPPVGTCGWRDCHNLVVMRGKRRYCSQWCVKASFYDTHPHYNKNWYDPERAKGYYRKYKAKPESKAKQREAALHRKYGISLADYQRLYSMQRGKCLICHRNEELVVDHDHESGLVRGLLCGPCNRVIGLMADDGMRLRAAAYYIEKRKGICALSV